MTRDTDVRRRTGRHYASELRPRYRRLGDTPTLEALLPPWPSSTHCWLWIETISRGCVVYNCSIVLTAQFIQLQVTYNLNKHYIRSIDTNYIILWESLIEIMFSVKIMCLKLLRWAQFGSIVPSSNVALLIYSIKPSSYHHFPNQLYREYNIGNYLSVSP